MTAAVSIATPTIASQPVAPRPVVVKKTLLLDCERGFGSVADLVHMKSVERLEIDSFQTFERVVEKIRTRVLQPDVVVIDSVTMLARKTRQNISLDTAAYASGNMWVNRKKLKSSLPDWGEMSDLIATQLDVLRYCEPMLILLCHEVLDNLPGERLEVRAPDLNAALLAEVVNYSDYVVRLTMTDREMTDGSGTKVPKGSRYLNLLRESDIYAGGRTVFGVNPPPVLYHPTLRGLRGVLGGTLPHVLTVYGQGKLGKTTFACSLSRPPKSTKAARLDPAASGAPAIAPDAVVQEPSQSSDLIDQPASLDAQPLAPASKENP